MERECRYEGTLATSTPGVVGIQDGTRLKETYTLRTANATFIAQMLLIGGQLSYSVVMTMLRTKYAFSSDDASNY